MQSYGAQSHWVYLKKKEIKKKNYLHFSIVWKWTYVILICILVNLRALTNKLKYIKSYTKRGNKKETYELLY